MDKVTYFFDLRLGTLRFDAVVGLLYANAFLQSKGKRELDIVVVDIKDSRRKDGPVTEGTSNAVRLHYLTSVLFEAICLIPNTNEIHVVTSRLQLIATWYAKRYSTIVPIRYTPWLPKAAYQLYDIEGVLDQKKPPTIQFEASTVFDAKVEKFLESNQVTGDFMVVSVRKKYWEKSYWNLNDEQLDQIFLIAGKLIESGEVTKVLLIPDFQDPYDQSILTHAARFLSTSDCCLVPEASLSVRFRTSLAKLAKLNICSTNGTSIFHLFSGSPSVFLNRDTSWSKDSRYGKILSNICDVYIVDDHNQISSQKILKLLSKQSSQN